MRILRHLLADFEDESYGNGFADLKTKLTAIDNKFMLAFIWGIGGSLATESRKQFDMFTKKLAGGDIPLEDEKIPRKKLSLPERSSLYDYSLVNKVINHLAPPPRLTIDSYRKGSPVAVRSH